MCRMSLEVRLKVHCEDTSAVSPFHHKVAALVFLAAFIWRRFYGNCAASLPQIKVYFLRSEPHL